MFSLESIFTSPRTMRLALKTIGQKKIDKFEKEFCGFFQNMPLDKENNEYFAAIVLKVNDSGKIELCIGAFDEESKFKRKIPFPKMDGKQEITFTEAPEFISRLLKKAEND